MRRIVFFSRALLMLALGGCFDDQLTGPRAESRLRMPKTISTTALNGKIAFVRLDATSNDTWVMNPDGTGQSE